MIESSKVVSEDLLEKYKELQLRVTKFSSIEQELINTRDKLDQELLMYKRLSKFNSNALNEKSLSALHRQIVEGLIDIFEIEASVLLICSADSTKHFLLETEGYNFKNENTVEFANSISNFIKTCQPEKGVTISAEDLNKYEIFAPFNAGLAFRLIDNESNKAFTLLGLISKRKAQLYREINEKTETLFNIFCQQVFTTYGNRLKSFTIERQLDQIKQSQTELIKLSLIAKKTKNGVIITDEKGHIEWVNESFTKTTEYELEEIMGKKPKDFLQKDSYKSDSAKILSAQLAKHKDVEVTIVNYTKSDKPFFNQLEVIPVKNENGELINFIALQKDITKEVEYRNEILRNNSRFELITNHSNIGVFEWDFESRISTWNHVLYEQYNIPQTTHPKDLLQYWLDCVYPTDKERVLSEFRRLTNNEINNLEIDFRIIPNNTNSIRYLRSIAIVEKSDTNKNIRLVGSTVDYTEKQKAEEELILNERKYRGIIENMNLGLIETDSKNNVVFVNQKFHDITEFSDPQELNLGSDPISFLEGRLAAGKLKSYKQLDTHNFEIEIVKKGRSNVNILVNVAPIVSKDKMVTGSIFAFLDITAEKALQHSLEDALEERNISIEKVNNLKHFYERILNNSPSKIAILSPTYEIVYANELMLNSNSIWKNSVGKKIDELRFQDNVNAKNFQLIKDNIFEAIRSNSLMQIELEYSDVFGNSTYSLFNILPIKTANKELQNVILTGTDITSIKQIQQAIQEKNDELSKINSELDNFVYSVSHDLRSPLLSIKGILSLIFNTSEINEEVSMYLKMADESIERLDGTIQEILEYSRNSRLDIEPAQFDIKEIVEVIYSDLKYSTDTNFEFNLNIEGGTIINSDKYRINTLLKNLIGNAVKYRQLDIPNPYVAFNLYQDESKIIMEIKDNGEGISDKNIDKVFDMFYRATSTSVGTGLGLYICKEIVNKLRGKITITSAVKVGTTVTIELPIL